MKQRTYLHSFNSPGKAARENLFYVESTGHYWCDKSFFEDSYYNQNYYLIYTVSGKGYVYLQNECINVGPGQLLYLDLSLPYKLRSDKKDPWEFLWVYFGGKDSDWYYHMVVEKSRPVFSLPSTAPIPGLLREIYYLHEAKDPFVEIRSSSLITCILTELYIAARTASGPEPDSQYVCPNAVKLAIDFIEQNYFRRIKLADLASLSFMSPYHFLRVFKKHTGLTPIEYLNNYRLEFSKKLLPEPELTIEQVSLNLGFNTHSYFSKIFKASTGLTPEQFRKICRR